MSTSNTAYPAERRCSTRGAPMLPAAPITRALRICMVVSIGGSRPLLGLSRPSGCQHGNAVSEPARLGEPARVSPDRDELEFAPQDIEDLGKDPPLPPRGEVHPREEREFRNLVPAKQVEGVQQEARLDLEEAAGGQGGP